MSSQVPGNFTTGDGRTVSIKEITDLFRDGVNLASPSSGRITHINNELYGLSCASITTDCDTLESVRTIKNYSLITTKSSDRHIESVHCISQPQLLAELCSVTSENGRFLARLRGGKDSDSKKQLLEIWDRSRLMRTIDISELEQHGLIMVDETFASMVWSPFGEQNKLLYVCQAKKPKLQSFFKQQVSEGKKPNLGDDNLKVEDWGEGLNGVEHTIVAVLEVPEMKISTLEVDGHSLADSQWLDGDRIVSTAYSERPHRLGLIYCDSRPSKLMVHELASDSSFEIIFEGQSVHSPRVDNSGKKLIFLKNDTYGPHRHSNSMEIFDLETKQTKELAQGLFVVLLPKNCFALDDKTVLFVNSDYFHSQLCSINVESMQIQKIKFPTTGINILDFRYDIILASGSEINTTPTLYVATLDSPVLVAWHQIEDCIHIEEVSYQLHRIPTSDKTNYISALTVSPNLRSLYRKFKLEDTGKTESQLPAIVIVHGGPHSAFLVSYKPLLILHARLGLKSVLINYRGSTGVDEDYLQSLCGRIGTQDVDDCLQVLRHLTKSKVIEPTKLIIDGGSHGGFISCHLSGQEEFKFKSAILRNPVVDLSTLHATSDIPDWCYTEALGHKTYDHGWLPDKENRIKMFEISPISKFRTANVPTLMLLGSNDRRVPMFQGERWVDLLRARNVETKCKVYADKHDLAKPDVLADRVITAMIWILDHL